MASMSRHERALSYAKRLKAASDYSEEAKKILNEINGLVWSKDSKSLSLTEKQAILDEIKKIIELGEKTDSGKIIVEAADNSGILDVIDMLKNNVK